MRPAITIAIIFLLGLWVLPGAVQAREVSVCTLDPVCPMGRTCRDAQLEIVFVRGTPVDGLWEGRLVGEAMIVVPARQDRRWIGQGRDGPHRFDIETDGAIDYHAPRRAIASLGGVLRWSGQCAAWR